VAFKNGEVELAGTLTLPEGAGPFPAALLISGSGAQDRNEEVFGHKPFLVLADHLTRAGVAVLRVDDRGVGGSGGSFADATSEDFADDARAGLRFLRTRGEIDTNKIGLIGHSEGAIIAPMVAATSEEVAYVVLLAGPGVPGDELLVRQQELLSRAAGMDDEQVATIVAKQTELLELVEAQAEEGPLRDAVRELVRAQLGAAAEPESVEQATAQATLTVTGPWFRYFVSHDPRASLRALKVPVLALIGEKDLQVDPRQNLPEIRKALQAGGNPDFTVEELEGLNHLFQQASTGAIGEYYRLEESFNPDALATIASWISSRFKKS
jgi:pimeloyl-ACP methyl ester carboxylesterase